MNLSNQLMRSTCLTLRSEQYDNGCMDLNSYLSRPGAPSATGLARTLGLNPDQVRQWRHRHNGRQPAPENCVAIERATEGAVTRRDLRPDDWHLIWPELIDQARTHGEVSHG